MPVILLLRKNRGELPEEAIAALEAAHPGASFTRSDPKDYIEHDNMCEEKKPTVTVVPMERPIPSLALEHGHRHVVHVPGQGLMEIKDIQVVLEPYVP